jgi:glycosyltransferase involved in cell wall biosynthesis
MSNEQQAMRDEQVVEQGVRADEAALNVGVCWLGGTRYTHPLNPTHDKKWRALSDQLGLRIHIISFASGARPRYFAPHARFYLLPALPLALLRYLTMYVCAPPLLLWLIARRGVRVVVAHDPYFGLIGALAKSLAGDRVALVVESHADFDALFLQRRVPLAGLMRRLMRWSARASLRRADVLRAVSSNTREQIAASAPPGLPLHQFITWTDMDAFSQQPRPLPPSQASDLLYAGVLIPRKGVHDLLAAFARIAPDHPDSHLWIVGSADNPAYAAGLRQQAAESGLGERIIFTGAVDQATLAGHMRRCRALVLPSYSEGLPRVVVEAMLAGMPVIATRVSGIPDVLRDGENGLLITPGDVDDLERALRRALGSAEVDDMAGAAQRFARAYFSVDAYLQGYRRLLADAAALLAGDAPA